VADRNIFFAFPGQGSQYKGMGTDLVREFDSAREIYRRASVVVGYDMERLSFDDPDGRIDDTRFTQPVLLTHQIACYESFRSLVDDRVQPLLAAGHSLGEYSALVASGALSFEDGLALVAERGRLMSEHGRGSMLATTLDLETAGALAARHYCAIGGANLPDQTVVAGDDDDLEALAADLAENYPGKRGIKLNTGGAFHTYLMITAALEFRRSLRDTDFHNLTFDVLSNYSGRLHAGDPDAIRSGLFFQLFNPVRWVECLNSAVDAGIERVIEFGGGIGKGDSPEQKRPNLEGMVKKFLKWREREAQYLPAINAAGIRAAAEQLSTV
jgi:[acyl-carrier-protein] S-malonyltransferase